MPRPPFRVFDLPGENFLSAPRFAWGSCTMPLIALSVGLWSIYYCLFSWTCSKEKWKKLCRFSKLNSQGWEIFKRSSIDRLSQMTPILDSSLFSQMETFKNDKIRAHECLYFLFETQSIKHFCFYFLLYSSFTTPSPNMDHEQFLIE